MNTMKKMTKSKAITPMVSKGIFVLACEQSFLNKLEAIAEDWLVRKEVVIEVLVRKFEPKFEDIIHFAKGGYKDTLMNKIVKAIKEKEKRLYIPLQLDEKVITKLSDSKRYYGMNKSSVLKHIINQYEKGIQ